MKHFLILFILLICIGTNNLFAQKDTDFNSKEISIQKTDNAIFEMGYVDFRIISPTALGSHFLSEGYDQDIAGFEFFLNIFKIYDFRIGLGHSRFGSSLTDASLAGNFKRASYRSYYVQVYYAIYQNKLLETGINLGYGVNYFRQRTRDIRRGTYDTGEWRAGIYGRYQLTENLGLSFGANYLTTNPDVKSAAESGDLFGRTHVIYPYLGLYINFE